MALKLEDTRDTLIQITGNFGSSLGINKVVAQLYALLYFSPHPLSLDDMMNTLKISKGHVSTNIRKLEEWGAAKRVWVKGSRRDFYQANKDMQGVIINRLQLGMKRRVDEIISAIDECEKELTNIPKEVKQKEGVTVGHYLKCIQEIKRYHKKFESLITNIKLLDFLK